MSDRPAPHLSTNQGSEQGEVDGVDELPVVARMVIEIRSDGSRTIARGAVEDCINDQRVAVDARADSPLELSRALMKMLVSAPFSAGSALLGRTKTEVGIEADPDTDVHDTGLGSRARALRRRLGERVEESLRARLRKAAKLRR